MRWHERRDAIGRETVPSSNIDGRSVEVIPDAHTRSLVLPLAALVVAASVLSRDAASQQVARPNILFAIADDWSFGHAGVYGAKWVRTPAIDRVAREGLLFTRAYTPNAKCAPSRAILLTGRHSWQLEEAANHIPFFPAKFKGWIETLGEKGHFAGMTG